MIVGMWRHWMVVSCDCMWVVGAIWPLGCVEMCEMRHNSNSQTVRRENAKISKRTINTTLRLKALCNMPTHWQAMQKPKSVRPQTATVRLPVSRCSQKKKQRGIFVPIGTIKYSSIHPHPCLIDLLDPRFEEVNRLEETSQNSKDGGVLGYWMHRNKPAPEYGTWCQNGAGRRVPVVEVAPTQ